MDRSSPVPLDLQLSATLKVRMGDGIYPPGVPPSGRGRSGRPLPCDQDDGAPGPGKLRAEGLLAVRRGIGTFAAQKRFARQATRMTGMYEDLVERGRRPSSRVLTLRALEIPPQLAARLDLPPMEPMIRLSRLRLADGEPAAVDRAWPRRALCPGLEREDLRNVSLYGLPERRHGLPLGHAEQRAEATPATPEPARLLGVRRGSPLLPIERPTCLKDGRPRGLPEAHDRADRHILHSVVYR